jgi:TIGR03009 family protein
MMRLTWATVLAALISAPTYAQQSGREPDYAHSGRTAPTPGQSTTQRQAQPEGQTPAAGQAQAQIARARQNGGVTAAATAPFPPLSAAALTQLQKVLKSWEAQSQSTKTLECKFKRWHYDAFAAPAGVHATYADGIIKYASPDKGLFRVDNLLFFNGMKDAKATYEPQPNKFGEHWVCNGEQLFELDRTKKECRIQDLPPNLKGQQIFNSPLPFVFNLRANEIQARYWVRQVQAPKPEIVLIEAWPKLQVDRAQYKLVQVALNPSFLPQALIMYAPNFDAKNAPRLDHYEFSDVKRNSIGQGLNKFIGNFIPEKPPANWTILRDRYTPPAGLPANQAAAPQPQDLR